MISVIIPFYNEAENLPILLDKLVDNLKKIKEDWEIVLVNDGSTDDSELRMKNLELRKQNSKIKLISHRKRLGKGKGLLTGFQYSKGEIIVLMDADLQNDPDDLSKFIDKINQGYDFVNGWRKDRNDPLSKTLPSAIFNYFILKVFLKSKFHDINCGFKAMNKEVIDEIPLYGDNYRFLPVLAEKKGFKTTEIIVQHHPRKFGKSKYGFFRLLFGFLDTVTTYFVYSYSEKPLHFFGVIGFIFFFVGFIVALYLTIDRLVFEHLLYRRPLLLFAILFIIVGIQVVMTGIIGELIVYLNKKK